MGRSTKKSPYPAAVRSALLLLVLLQGIAAATAVRAIEIYRWIDSEGVVQYTQTPPASLASSETLHIASSNPPDWDPSSYHHSIANQARRTAEARAEMERRRREARAVVAPGAPLASRQAAYVTPVYALAGAGPVRHQYWSLPASVPSLSYRWHGPAYSPYLSQQLAWPRHREHGSAHPVRAHRQQEPRWRLDSGQRFAHPARSHRRLGAHLRFGYLGHRYTHRPARISPGH